MAAVIPKVMPKRGTRVGGLLRYLYGPGKREEHVNPRLVAAWDGAGPLVGLEPSAGGAGKRDFRHLVSLLEQPVRAGFNPPHHPVWHCAVRNHASDRVLTDQQWAHIAREMVAGIGIAPYGDDRAVRWVAVRHAADHIHIVATLVRQDRRTEWARNERWRAQATARDLEERYGLYRVGPADRTAHRHPHSVEVNKALRTGRREAGRDQLRREVRYAAAAAGSTEEFFRLLDRAGVKVRVRYSTVHPDEVTGYAVALPDHTTAAGAPVWYGGGRLAPDLTLPQLRLRWGEAPTAATAPAAGRPGELYEQIAAQVRAAAEDIRRSAGADQAGGSAAAHAAADTLTMAARLIEGRTRGPLHRAAEALDHATRVPYRRPPPRSRRAEALRSMSRLMCLAGQLSDDQVLFAMLRMILDLSLLADALAEMRDAAGLAHQARAARAAERLLREAVGSAAANAGGVPDAGVTPPPTPPVTRAPTQPRDRRRADRPATAGQSR